MALEQKGKKRKSVDTVETDNVKKIKKAVLDTVGSKRKAKEEPAVLVAKKVKTPKAEPEKLPKAQKVKEITVTESIIDSEANIVSKISKKSKIVKVVEKQPQKSKNAKNGTAGKFSKSKSSQIEEQIPFEEGSDENQSDEDSEDDDDVDDQTEALLKGFESDDEEDEEDGGYKAGDIIPAIDKKSKKKAKKAAQSSGSDGPGVVYLGRIPHGFYEHEMRQYFGQFGDISRLRLSRNRKTGRSKHFAFIEFKSAEVAEIVTKTMDNYLLFGHILKCKLVQPEQVHPALWKGANKRFKKVPWNRMEGRKLAQGTTEEGWERRIAKEETRRTAKAKKMKELGYEYESPSLKSVKDAPRASKALTAAEDAVVEDS